MRRIPANGAACEYGTTAEEGRPVSSFLGSQRAIWRSARAFGPAVVALGLLGISACGCGEGVGEPVDYGPPPPLVEESYELDDANRPLTEDELTEASARLTSDSAAFVAELEKAPPVRQASMIYVLQRDAALARAHRPLLEKLSTSPHGIVRRAALFALESIAENPVPATN